MTVDAQEKVLWKAEFDRRVRTYWLLGGALGLTVTLVGIPLLPLWFAVGWFATEHYLRRMSCVLTDRALKFGKGMLVRVEKTVPLDKITDMGLVQGPIMRHFGIETLSVETAGQSSEGSLLKLTGITDARKFRDAVLRQRDVTVAATAGDAHPPGVSVAGVPSSDAVLIEIRDTLQRIERRLPGTDDA